MTSPKGEMDNKLTKHSGKKAVTWGREGSKSQEELVDVIYGRPLRHIEKWFEANIRLGKSFTISTEQE